MTGDEARAELAEGQEWLSRYQQMQQDAPGILQRIAWLNGFLEGLASNDPPREG